jgi:hypothetical protein
VPGSLLAKTQELRKYFDLSFEHAATMKNKTRTKKSTR